MLAVIALLFLLLPATPGVRAATDPAFSAEAIRAHVTFLADDRLEGRDTGSAGHAAAARYVARQFEAIGLKPAGDRGGWYQQAPFQRTSHGPTPGTVTMTGPAGETGWTHGADVLIAPNAREAHIALSAPVVFVGYGIDDARLGLDDYAGLDVRGKIVVALRGYPAGLPDEEGAYLAGAKARTAQTHGAIGLFSIDTIRSMKARPWARLVQAAAVPRFSWIGDDGRPFDESPGIRVAGSLNSRAAAALFAGAPRSIAAIRRDAAKPGGRPRGFALNTRMAVRFDSVSQRVTSPNVVGVVPGNDPALKGQHVVLVAHLDHIGVTPAAADDSAGPATVGDRINNGALDNAAGVATMLEVARAMARSADGPRRSILFLASTGEEKGLLGAKYFVHHAPVPIDRIIGAVSIDMPLLLYPFTDVIAFGADHSTLGPIVAGAVAPMGVTVMPDPMPQETIFLRSDHYMFARKGVPAMFLATGYANGGKDAWRQFLGGAYHRPGDDLSQPIDWAAGARFAEVNYRVARALADGGTPPRWYRRNFFSDMFAPHAARAPDPGQR